MIELMQGDCLELMKYIPDGRENTGRSFIGIELDAGYFAIAKDRIEHAKGCVDAKADRILP